MKQTKSLLALVSLLAATAAPASDWMLGASLGMASGETGSREINRQLSDSALDAQASSSDDNRSAWQIRLGYAFTPHWGIELGYVDLGDVETTFTGSASDIDSFLSASRDIHPNTADGLLLSGVYRHPLGGLAEFNGVARAGAFIWSSEYKLDGVTASRTVDENGTDFSFGLGMELGLAQMSEATTALTLQLDWNRFGIDGEHIDLFSIGLSHRFK